MGCCDPNEPQFPPIDLCDDEENPGVCAGGLGLCEDQLYSTVCRGPVDPSQGCTELFEGIPEFGAVYCETYGQLVCNELIAIDFASKDYFCNGICCEEP